MLKKEKMELSAEQWIELFDEFFKANPSATYIPSSKPTLKSKIKNLKKAYDNGQGQLTAGEQKVINWFIDTGRENILLTKKTNKKDGALGDDDDQTTL